MPRANRHFLPGYVWHITHRCHRKNFLLKFARDRRGYLSWLFEARKRFGLCVLNYAVTSNHVHLLVKDTGKGVMANSMQLAAGRTAQEFNQRKKRQGAFWEDRYHATAVEGDEHLHRCLVYIDLNMVRAGVVGHPDEWPHGGYREIQHPPERYKLIDLNELSVSCGFPTVPDFQKAHCDWVAGALTLGTLKRDARWSESIAVGGEQFVAQIKSELGVAVRAREIDTVDHRISVLRESEAAYTCDLLAENDVLRSKMTRSDREIAANAKH